MLWGHTNNVQKYWLTRLDILKRRAPRVQSEVISMMQRTQRLYDSGRVDEASIVAAAAKNFFVDFSNELEEAVTHIEARGGVNLRGLDEVQVSMERTREDLGLLEEALLEESENDVLSPELNSTSSEELRKAWAALSPNKRDTLWAEMSPPVRQALVDAYGGDYDRLRRGEATMTAEELQETLDSISQERLEDDYDE